MFTLAIEEAYAPSRKESHHPVDEAVIYEQIAKGCDLVVSLSGGKDSTATYLHLLEQGVFDKVEQAGGQVRRVFADTGWELDETYAYLDVLADRFGPIDRVALWVPGHDEAPPTATACSPQRGRQTRAVMAASCTPTVGPMPN
jgi:3'-phosphoadenosine 5'-phosphosulfate sulfotransferase (PAPS reductase)/FAD synthetase